MHVDNVIDQVAALERRLTLRPQLGDSPEVSWGRARDTVMTHPTYGSLGWVAVTRPGERASDQALTLLRSAHARERGHRQRRASPEQE